MKIRKRKGVVMKKMGMEEEVNEGTKTERKSLEGKEIRDDKTSGEVIKEKSME